MTTPGTQPRILIIYTGGTIGMIEDPFTRSLRPFDFDHLIENVPKLKMLNYVIDNIQFDPPIDSTEMDPSHWEQIARSIADNYRAYDGFVVLHGTDTMAYTASALSFMLENLSKPVIITGSQLPIGEVRTDGEENLITAVQIAAERAADGIHPMVQEVAILFENYLWRGNRSTKISADNFNAFKSHNYPSLAKIGLGIYYNPDALAHRANPEALLRPHYAMDPNVTFIHLFPGMKVETLRWQLRLPGLRGVVLRTYGAGNAPCTPEFVDALKEAIDRGVVILNVSQCFNGSVRKLYAVSECLEDIGVVSGLDLTPEAAVTKMMYLFGRGFTPAEVRRALTQPVCGEMTL